MQVIDLHTGQPLA